MTLRVDTIQNEAGTGPVELYRQSAAKHWHASDGSGTVTINDSFNTSSMTDRGTGRYTHNFINNFSSLHFSPTSNFNSNASSSWGNGSNATFNKTTNEYQSGSNLTNGTPVDSNFVQVAAWGDLA